MTDAIAVVQQPLFEDIPVAELGSIAIRVVVLPPKNKKGLGETKANETFVRDDLEPDEYLADVGATPLGSYLESSKGKRCCVFLVNGQRQESLDNSFIVQELGFKYLRNRMMVVVDVDGLAPEAIGRLMQGSRQGFYRGDTWNAINRRVVATLKDDPDLLRLEEEAEQQVADLKAGDEKVKQALDQLIEAHHEHGWHFAEGGGTSGEHHGGDLGSNTITKDGVVSLLPPDKGQSADYPVLLSQPSSSSIRLRPNQAREVNITALPSGHWPALAQFTASGDSTVNELSVQLDKLADHGTLTLCFKEPEGFDNDQYPVRACVHVTARFNGIKEPRQLSLQVVVKPDQQQPDPILLDEPTQLKISSREPVKIRRGETDAHVRLRWDGKDRLVTGKPAAWRFSARLLNNGRAQPAFNFSEPALGRFSLLISPRPEWQAGDQMEFEVTARSETGRQLTVAFVGEIVEPPTEDDAEERKPRLVDGELTVGARRRPPYKLMYINRDQYERTLCWGETPWSDMVPGCFIEPTDRTPLMLIINEDMDALCEYKRELTKKNTEQAVERKVNKYTSHIAYHLYQMYQASQAKKEEENLDLADLRRRDEIRRVSMTLIKLMDVG